MDRLKVKGYVRLRKNGLLIREGRNLVVATGENFIANMIGSTDTAMTHMAIGNGGTATSSGMTALQGTEIERQLLSGVTVNANVVTWSASFGSLLSITSTVREVGIFNAASVGTMLARFICAGFSLSPGETLDVDWSLAFGD